MENDVKKEFEQLSCEIKLLHSRIHNLEKDLYKHTLDLQKGIFNSFNQIYQPLIEKVHQLEKIIQEIT